MSFYLVKIINSIYVNEQYCMYNRVIKQRKYAVNKWLTTYYKLTIIHRKVIGLSALFSCIYSINIYFSCIKQ